MKYFGAEAKKILSHGAALTAWDHKVYYPGTKELHLQLTGDQGTGRLIGVQVLGYKEFEVSSGSTSLALRFFRD